MSGRGRRRRSRKRSGSAERAPLDPAGSGERASSATVAPARRRERRGARPGAASGGVQDALPLGERPQAPWHPLPLSELLILIGAIGVAAGLLKGGAGGAAPLIAGLIAVAAGTVEVTLREHLSGYRSHAILLTVLPLIVLDSVLALLIAPFTAAMKVAMLLVDVAVFTFGYKLLRARFHDARRERIFQGRR